MVSMSLIPSGELKDIPGPHEILLALRVSMSLIPSGELKEEEMQDEFVKMAYQVSMSLIPSGELKVYRIFSGRLLRSRYQ